MPRNIIYIHHIHEWTFLSEKNVIDTIKSGLDRLIISIDGTTQEVYEQYRKVVI